MITSTKNDWVLKTKALLTGRERGEQGLFLIEGTKLLQEALSASLTPRWALVDPNWQVENSELASCLQTACDELLPAELRVIAAASQLQAPQGVLAVFELPKANPIIKPNGLYAALDGIQDPGNMGTILRTADALGLDGVLLSPTCADPFSLKALRGGMGAAFHLSISRDPLPQRLTAFRDLGYDLIAGDLNAPDFFLREHSPKGVVLIIGSEGQGISEDVRELVTQTYSLPMPGGAESLNAAVAAGIMLYDFWRSRT